MKTSLDILKSWFQTGDKPTENQFKNLIDSFHHKDDGNIITGYELYDNGDVSFTLSDGTIANIKKFVLPNTMPQSYIEGLVETLNNKVTKETGKQLSDENFSLELKQKLTRLQNYIHPEFHQITEIQGLQEAIESKVTKVSGKQLSDENFSTEEKEKLTSLENYSAPTSLPINYIEELEDTLNELDQKITTKVDIVDGKQLSDENFSTEEKEKLASFDITTFSSISDGENVINAKGQADRITFEGATVDVDKNIIKVNGSGLEKITEETQTGWRLSDQDSEYFGTIGVDAVDLSQNRKLANDTTGATGLSSFAANLRTTASAQASSAFGRDTQALGNESFATGGNTTAYSFSEFSIGHYNTEYKPTSKISASPEDRVFNVGNGNASQKSDAFTILKNGAITAPTLTKELIEKTGDKALITKEYADITYNSQKSSVLKEIDLSYFNTKSDEEVKFLNILKNPVPNSVIIPTYLTVMGYIEPFTEYGYFLSLGLADLKTKDPYVDTFHNVSLVNFNTYTATAPYIESNTLSTRYTNLKEYSPNFNQGVNLVGAPKKVIDSLKGKLTIRLEYFTIDTVNKPIFEEPKPKYTF